MYPNLQFFIIKPKSYISLKNDAKQYLNNVIKAYKYVEKLVSIIQVAYIHLVSNVTLDCKINSCYNEVLYKIVK